MRTLDWDYTGHANAYVNRPDYSDAAIDAILAIVKPGLDVEILDLGAGAGHLTYKLAERDLPILALEPNADMRSQGQARTKRFGRVRWVDAVMERTGLEEANLPIATYGSSFGVVDRMKTLDESARLLTNGGWFVCLFNHRNLSDPLQQQIEDLIKSHLPDYDYGTRRQDQSEVIAAHDAFGPVYQVNCPILHRVSTTEWVDAWYSHVTLKRQAGAKFDTIVDEIGTLVNALNKPVLDIPYTTCAWLAQRKPRTQ